MVSVGTPPNKGGRPDAGKVDEGHQMLQHQLTNLKQNVETLLAHLSQCNCPHVQEEETKKKIILAADYLDSARDYVMSSHGGGEHDEHDDGGGFMDSIEKRIPQ